MDKNTSTADYYRAWFKELAVFVSPIPDYKPPVKVKSPAVKKPAEIKFRRYKTSQGKFIPIADKLPDTEYRKLYRSFRRHRLEKYACSPVCEKCGAAENLQIHHINGIREGHHQTNLQTLCVSCHSLVHGKRIPSKYCLSKRLTG